MTEEWTVGDIFEDLAERVASARTHALMGERQEALALLQRVCLDFMRFREVLREYPGARSLEQSIETAQHTLCGERAEDGAQLPQAQAGATEEDPGLAA